MDDESIGSNHRPIDITTLREHWLMRAIDGLRPHFEACGLPAPTKIRASVGLPAQGRAGKGLGETWLAKASASGHVEISVSLKISEPLTVLAVVVAQLVEAVAPQDSGRGAPYKEIAIKIGLQGRMKNPSPGPELLERFIALLPELGPYPHAAVDTDWRPANKPKKQSIRMLAAKCPTCGYTARVARIWLKRDGPPPCPRHHIRLKLEQPLEDDAPEGAESADKPRLISVTPATDSPETIEVDVAASDAGEIAPAKAACSGVQTADVGIPIQWSARFPKAPPDEIRANLKAKFAARFQPESSSWYGTASSADLQALRTLIEPSAGTLEVSSRTV